MARIVKTMGKEGLDSTENTTVKTDVRLDDRNWEALPSSPVEEHSASKTSFRLGCTKIGRQRQKGVNL